MHEIDNELKRDNVPIHARQMQAATRIASKLNCKMLLFPPDEFCSRIFEWFEMRYGNQLLIDFSPGTLIFLIQNDVFTLKFPKIYGPVELILDRQIGIIDYSVSSLRHKDDTTPPIKLNPLDFVENLTSAYASTLSDQELTYIREVFKFGCNCYNTINLTTEHSLTKSLIADLKESVNHLTSRPPHFGKSKWASFQATEKMLKTYIRSKGKATENTHNLNKLVAEAEKVGLNGCDMEAIKKVQANASIRYDNVDVTLIDAIEAHHNSLKLCSFISTCINE